MSSNTGGEGGSASAGNGPGWRVDAPGVAVGRGPTAVDPDDVFGAVRERPRRYVIHALAQSDGPVAVDDLADRVAGWMDGTRGSWGPRDTAEPRGTPEAHGSPKALETSGARRETANPAPTAPGADAGPTPARMRLALQQVHLPKMAEAGVLEYEPDRGVVRSTAATAAVRSSLEAVPPADVPWRLHAALVVGAFLVGVAVVGGAAPVDSLPSLVGVLLPAAAVTVVGASLGATLRGRRLGRDGPPPRQL
ncbi:DUF7344 domain-containing protein [Candidatus Halobonum tyrrellensis]|uniref:DUF7344 domain-containing protein n=1 Tax=Candidatus Halobonum tyrrellensis TaxID=1431545 RepID=UPI000677BD5E|nr:hypothetical protein [Candidatus Halobonum tyrrellensis]